MPNHIGFTGTREGMSGYQDYKLRQKLEAHHKANMENWFHHGDCVGSDAQAGSIARELGFKIATHPPINDKLRAFCYSDHEFLPKSYSQRNRLIVTCSSILIATPLGKGQEGGTWQTIRMAERIPGYFIEIIPFADPELHDG